MEELASELLKELNCDTAFSIKLPAGLPLIGGVQLDIAESVVITWVVMAVILILSIILTSNLKVHNVSRRQLVAETIVTKLEGIVTGMIGEEGKRYVPYLVSVLLYLGISNIIGLFGMKPPTKDLNVTAALALMSIVLVEAAGIRKKGVGGWIKSFTEPIAIVTPINILEVFIKPLSLCMRLFGNVLGAFVIMELLKLLVPVALPVPFSFYFDIFDGLIQAYVFVFLTSCTLRKPLSNWITIQSYFANAIMNSYETLIHTKTEEKNYDSYWSRYCSTGMYRSRYRYRYRNK